MLRMVGCRILGLLYVFSADVSVPQTAWIQSGSIRSNITFSTPQDQVDQDKLARAVYASGLQDDLSKLEDGIE